MCNLAPGARHNTRLLRIVSAPLVELYNGPHDPWHFENGGLTFRGNPTWHAARIESDRRRDLYNRLVPLSKWGITS